MIRTTKILLFVSIGLGLVSILIVTRAYRERSFAQHRVDHTYRVIQGCDRILSSYQTLDLLHRKQPSSSAPGHRLQFEEAVKHVRISVDHVRVLTIDNPAQTTLIDHELYPAMNAILADWTTSFADQTTNATTPDNTTTINTLVAELISRENALLKLRYTTLSRISLAIVIGVSTALSLIIIVTFIAYVTLTRVHNKKPSTGNNPRRPC